MGWNERLSTSDDNDSVESTLLGVFIIGFVGEGDVGNIDIHLDPPGLLKAGVAG